jgi:predicted ATPase/transcriptional regulator with XRE-family HTH domain
MEDEGWGTVSSDFGTLLRCYRLGAGLSQEALAERARMSANGIGSLERGSRRSPQRETLALLADALALTDEQREAFEVAARSGPRRLGRVSNTAGPWPDAWTSSLPLALTSFVGRKTELVDIATLVREHRLVTLTGAGGVGKTQTALQIGTAPSDPVDGVCFVGLAPVVDPSLVAAAIASTLGVQAVPEQPLLETLQGFLKNKSLLLILDNCEHVITEVASVAERLLLNCPRLRILATSREPLKAAGERSYRLPSLSVPSPEVARNLSPADAQRYGAIVLFIDRAQAVDHRFASTDENAPMLAELCRRLDGIPLAIELAAARVNLLPVKALAKRLEDRFRLLTGGERTALPRQQTMRATIDWSYDLLAPAEQRVFERLAVFVGGCTLESAAAVCADGEISSPDVFDLLSSLVDKSLVTADLEDSEPRYRLLESFQQYAREKLRACGEDQTVARRHVLAYFELASRFRSAPAYYHDPIRFTGHSTQVSRTHAQRELDNWRAALQWALVERGDVVLGQRLAAETIWAFPLLEGQRWTKSALRTVDAQTPTVVLANLRLEEASLARVLCETEAELASSQQAIAHYREAGDLHGIARAQSIAGHALLHLGRNAEAQSLLQEALAAARDLEEEWLAAYILRCLGLASAREGDFDAARRYVETTLPIYEQLDLDSVPWALQDLGEHAFGAGDPQLALHHATSMLAIAREHDMDARCCAQALTDMAVYLTWLARYDEAEQSARESLDLTRENDLPFMTAWNLQHLAVIAALRPRAVFSRQPHIRAARVLGFVDARLDRLGSTRWMPQRQEYDRALAAVYDAIEAQQVAKEMAAGAAMTEEQVVAECLNSGSDSELFK